MTMFKRSLLFAVLAIPTQESTSWQIEAYSRIPKNEVSFSPEGLSIKVHKSASPMIYALPKTTKITGFKLKGTFRGLPRFADVSKQGSKGADDYALRIGLLVPGAQQLTGVKKFFAPEWVKKLYARVPEGQGLDHVHFYALTQNPAQVGTQRTHPASDLLQEEFFAAVEKPGDFEYSYTFKESREALGIWLSSDGDDTESDFEVLIANLELLTQD